MKKSLISALKIIVPLGIGIFVMVYFYYKMTEVERQTLWSAFKRADYFWVGLSLVIAWASHMSRAIRWKYQLEPLGCKPNKWNSYHSVMLGYLLNLAIPRAGEPGRAGYLARYENITFEKAFGTIFVERIVDTLMLGLIFLITLALQAGNKGQFQKITNRSSDGGGISIWVYVGIGLVVAIVAGILAYKNPKIKEKIIQIVKGFFEGITSFVKMRQKGAFLGHTFFIWGAYIVMFWVCFFSIPETQNLPIAAVFASFIAGTIAVVLTPGGIGLYPIMVAEVLVLYDVPRTSGYAVGAIMWASQNLLYVILGLSSLIYMPIMNKNKT